MVACNLKFIQANVLRAAKLRIGTNIMFSAYLGKMIEV